MPENVGRRTAAQARNTGCQAVERSLDSGSGDRRFESFRPSQLSKGLTLQSAETRTLSQEYLDFAQNEVRGKSPLYERLCTRIAVDDEVLSFLMQQPPEKRQPNLVLASVRFLFGTPSDYGSFRQMVLRHRGEVATMLASRRTQTNEPGRCAVLLPVLCLLPQPLSLIEVGAAAGLCLLPDRYGYDYGGRRIGPDEVVFNCLPRGGLLPVPERLPDVVWRAGIDLEPIDPRDGEAARWLETLVWPEEVDRLEGLRMALEIARRDPPRILRGNLLDLLLPLAAEAPRDATLVVFHSAVLPYLSAAERARFGAQVQSLDAEWISNESEEVSGEVLQRVARPPIPIGTHRFVVARNGSALAVADPHGRWIEWVAD